MDSPLVTVVVPIYKSSNYLSKCLDSLIQQTLENIEIILVNDASPDIKDHYLCEQYANQDQRIKYLIHEKNKGQGGARNTGIVNARSNYIGFVDSDDWVEIDMYEKLFTAIKRKKADVSQCYFVEHVGAETNVRKLKSFRPQKDFLNATNVLVWNKLFKRELFIDHEIYFPESHSHEDTATLPRLIYFVNSMALVRQPLYHYLVAREGATTTNYERIFSDHSEVFLLMKQFMIDNEVWNSHRSFYERRIVRSLLHDLSRLIKDDDLQDQEKENLIKNGLEKSIMLFRYPTKIVRSPLLKTKTSLQSYKQKLIIEDVLRLLGLYHSDRTHDF